MLNTRTHTHTHMHTQASTCTYACMYAHAHTHTHTPKAQVLLPQVDEDSGSQKSLSHLLPHPPSRPSPSAPPAFDKPLYPSYHKFGCSWPTYTCKQAALAFPAGLASEGEAKSKEWEGLTGFIAPVGSPQPLPPPWAPTSTSPLKTGERMLSP